MHIAGPPAASSWLLFVLLSVVRCAAPAPRDLAGFARSARYLPSARTFAPADTGRKGIKEHDDAEHLASEGRARAEHGPWRLGDGGPAVGQPARPGGRRDRARVRRPRRRDRPGPRRLRSGPGRRHGRRLGRKRDRRPHGRQGHHRRLRRGRGRQAMERGPRPGPESGRVEELLRVCCPESPGSGRDGCRPGRPPSLFDTSVVFKRTYVSQRLDGVGLAAPYTGAGSPLSQPGPTTLTTWVDGRGRTPRATAISPAPRAFGTDSWCAPA